MRRDPGLLALRRVAVNLHAGLVAIVDVAVEAVADFGYANVVVSATKRSHLEAIQPRRQSRVSGFVQSTVPKQPNPQAFANPFDN